MSCFASDDGDYTTCCVCGKREHFDLTVSCEVCEDERRCSSCHAAERYCLDECEHLAECRQLVER